MGMSQQGAYTRLIVYEPGTLFALSEQMPRSSTQLAAAKAGIAAFARPVLYQARNEGFGVFDTAAVRCVDTVCQTCDRACEAGFGRHWAIDEPNRSVQR